MNGNVVHTAAVNGTLESPTVLEFGVRLSAGSHVLSFGLLNPHDGPAGTGTKYSRGLAIEQLELLDPPEANALTRPTAQRIAARRPDAVVIGADTVVVARGRRLGKPRDKAEAREMLLRLHGRRHEVWTGLAVLHGGERRTASECTTVHVARMTPEDLEGYLATGESLDKAGAYGIQGVAGQFIKRIEGDYTNVVGLPLARLRALLEEFA